MKFRSKIRSLQWFLPTLLAIFGLLIVTLDGIFTFFEGQKLLEQKIATDIRSQMSQLQANLADSLNHGDKNTAQREIAYQGVNPSINDLILLDEQGVILLSLHYSDLGQPASMIKPSFKMPDQDIRLGFLLHKQNHIFQAYFPIQLHIQANRLRNHQNSWLYMEFNGAYQYGRLLQEIKFNILILIFGVMLTTILTWWILRIMVIRPLVKQGEVAQKIGQGELEFDIAAPWFNELSLLSHAMYQMANNLKIANKNLKHEAKEREKLIHQLEEKNAELERFTYTVSHDLKSPLVTIKGFVGLLIKDIKNDRPDLINSDIEKIASAADKMALLLDDLLDLSRVGHVVNQPKLLSLNLLFEDVLNLIHGQIEESGAQIEIQTDMPSIFADKHRMQEVAQNLLDNAIKFTHKGTIPQVFVSAAISGDKVICCVTDNGIGINPEYKQQIFGLFDRLDPSYEGTGVGLALVKRIIDVHNGKISVEAADNTQGSKFCFSLPIAKQE